VRLRITSVHTLSHMKSMFRAAYSTRVQALTDLMRRFPNCATFNADGTVGPSAGPQPSEQHMRAAAVDLIRDIHQYCAYSKAQQADLRTIRPEWTQSYIARLQDLTNELELHSVAPEMYDIPFSVDVQSWLQRNQAAINCDHADMSGLQPAHVFGIEKDPDNNNTYLYNSFLAESTKNSRESERHHYPKQLTGDYTTRSIMFHAASQMPHPPHRKLAVPLDFKLHRDTIAAYAIDHLEEGEPEELLEMIAEMENGVMADAARCAVCQELMQCLRKVGVISRKDLTTEQEERANRQNKEKTKIKRMIAKHMLDSEYATQHTGLAENNWWEKWTNRSRFFIQPEYQRRDKLSKEKAELFRERMPYHLHPLRLCSSKDEPAIFEISERVDCRWALSHNTPPMPDDYVVLRSQEPNEAFMIGRIKKLLPNEESDQRMRKAHDKRQRVLGRHCGFDENISRARAQPIHARNLNLHPHDATLLQYMSNHMPGVAGELPAGDLRLLWRTERRCYEVRASRHALSALGQPCSLGLFAVRDIAPGEAIDWYSVFLTEKEELRQAGAVRTHAYCVSGTGWVLDGWPMAQAMPRYVAHTEEAQVRMLTMPAPYFHPRQLYGQSVHQTSQQTQLLQRFDTLPKGCLANSGDAGRRNCKYEHHACARDLSNLCITTLPYVRATKPIKCGEELLVSYNNNEERTADWESVPHADTVDVPMEPADVVNVDAQPAQSLYDDDEVRHVTALAAGQYYGGSRGSCLLRVLVDTVQ